ncbi:hypothetical protein BLNAU_21647 [Blattamonas nauphoetae]|uniref:RRM domain-containing protein n=1 Tax=Blattamonas nauphoetae TaxID=2049346 RepID=A0ABQ9WWG3_9EUKA|nr:hypothetical protein BLNAU_21647 [Blattamonas nauphoetae]
MSVRGSTGSQRTAFVEFEKDEEARNCERGLNGKKVCATGLFKAGDDPTKAGDIICEKNNTHTTLYVRGFRPEAKDKLRELFNHYGNVIECLPHLDKGRTWANVVMEDMSQAQRAISQIHMQDIDGFGKMFVELFVPKNQRMKKPAPQGAFMGMPQMQTMNQPGNPPQYMMPPMGQYPMMPYGQNMMGGSPMQYNYMNPQMAQQMPQQGYPPQQQGRGQMGQQRYQNRQPRNSAQNQPRPAPNPQPQQTQISSRNFPPFDKTELANKSEDDQKQTIGEYIYPIVLDMDKSDDYAGKITCMLIAFPLHVLVQLVGTPDQLQKKIIETYEVLEQSVCQSSPSESDRTIVKQRDPFLDFELYPAEAYFSETIIWNVLVELVNTIRPIDKALADRAARLLPESDWGFDAFALARNVLTALVPSSIGSPSPFHDSFFTLLASPHPTVVTSTITFLHAIAQFSTTASKRLLVESDMISNVFATIQPHTLSLPERRNIIHGLVRITNYCVYLAFPSSLIDIGLTAAVDEFNHREMIFQKVVLPSSPIVAFLISNRSILNRDFLDSFVSLLCTHVRISPYHHPTLEYVLASPIAMSFSSCLSIVEIDHALWMNLDNINRSLGEWMREGPEVVKSGKRMMQALFSEGFKSAIEQMLKQDENGVYGEELVKECHSLSQKLGSNVDFTNEEDLE